MARYVISVAALAPGIDTAIPGVIWIPPPLLVRCYVKAGNNAMLGGDRDIFEWGMYSEQCLVGIPRRREIGRCILGSQHAPNPGKERPSRLHMPTV